MVRSLASRSVNIAILMFYFIICARVYASDVVDFVIDHSPIYYGDTVTWMPVWGSQPYQIMSYTWEWQAPGGGNSWNMLGNWFSEPAR
jgi:hypothetical protein